MAVFISYKKEDEGIARQIDSTLKSHHIETYLDILDPSLIDKTYITKKILNGLHRCSHLLAIISTITSESWWVPFEIGVATEGDKRIITYSTISIASLPDYLKIWPIISQMAQIGMFARRYNNDKLVLAKAYKIAESQATAIQTANDFHRLLKTDLGQT